MQRCVLLHFLQLNINIHTTKSYKAATTVSVNKNICNDAILSNIMPNKNHPTTRNKRIQIFILYKTISPKYSQLARMSKKKYNK
uniref:Uncharacterized protein n=1 Tax=Octopus bimaculoides TaxID=37653 RepID=A0A0L8FIH7_OCTBM